MRKEPLPLPLLLAHQCFGHLGLASVEDPDLSGQALASSQREGFPAREARAQQETAAVRLQECVCASSFPITQAGEEIPAPSLNCWVTLS